MAQTAAEPADKEEQARWFEAYRETLGAREITAAVDRPFWAAIEYVALDDVGLGRGRGSMVRIERRRDHVARDADDRFAFWLNRSSEPAHMRNAGRDAVVNPGCAVLWDYAETGANTTRNDHRGLCLLLPRIRAIAEIRNLEDLTGTVVPRENAAVRLLSSYADLLLDDDALNDPLVLRQAGQNLMDLAVLAIRIDRDGAEAARLGGLRAARLAAVLRCIRRDYADPDISPESVAGQLGISVRYLHDLLHQTGSSFAERVLELRLAKVFAALVKEDGPPPRISDVAYAAGFNDLSYFNRTFRRRYGLSPKAARGRPN